MSGYVFKIISISKNMMPNNNTYNIVGDGGWRCVVFVCTMCMPLLYNFKMIEY